MRKRASSAVVMRALSLGMAGSPLRGAGAAVGDEGRGRGGLSEGYIEADVVECNFHNGQFNIKTGEVVSPPCMVPIKTYKTVVENGRVLIEIEESLLTPSTGNRP